MPTEQERQQNIRAVEWASEQVAAGRAVLVQVGHHVTKWSPDLWENWKTQQDAQPMKVGKDGSLLMIEGTTRGRPNYVRVVLASNTRLTSEAAPRRRRRKPPADEMGRARSRRMF